MFPFNYLMQHHNCINTVHIFLLLISEIESTISNELNYRTNSENICIYTRFFYFLSNHCALFKQSKWHTSTNNGNQIHYFDM